MLTNKNEFTMYRGESVTLDYDIRYKSGEPLVVSYNMKNPHLLLSISNTAYAQDKREVRNYWFNLADFPKFELTTPMDLQSLKNGPSENAESMFSKFSDITEFPIEAYYNGELVTINKNGAVFCNSLEPGQYKYWSDGRWYDYKLSLVHTFSSEDTKNWSSQKYYYTIQLVEGQDLRTYLCSLYEEDATELSNVQLYNALKDIVDFPIDLDATQPFYKITNSIPILSPTSIKVISYMQGDITW